MPILSCQQCSTAFKVIPARAGIAKFCSVACKAKWQGEHLKGETHPRWTGGNRVKQCAECGDDFTLRPSQPITTFKTQKFCSKSCADKGGFRYSGKEHPNYREDARRKNRGFYHSRWADAVTSRDKATCQHCGAQGVELHAHHIKPYRDNPDLRDDVSNGVTLCFSCHWNVHTANGAKGVNSGEAAAGSAGGNPEPSHDGNIVEGVTTNGRAYRRWVGECVWCGTFISRRMSDVIGKQWQACSYSCSSKHSQKLRGHGSNSDTSAPPVKG